MKKNETLKAAGYSKTTPAENKSIATLHRLIKHEAVICHTEQGDKTPNIDGYLDMVDAELVPLGKLEVQIKTLHPKNIKQPKYQCKSKLLAYCQSSQLPVLLLVANSKDNLVYWLEMNEQVVAYALERMTGDSVSIDLPLENIIDGKDESYIPQWLDIINRRRKAQIEYPIVSKRREELEKAVEVLNRHVNVGVGKKQNHFREIHIFLDFYNGLLDREFQFVKQVMYPDYWKLGIGLIKYEPTEILYILYPIEYLQNDVLIKEFNKEDGFNLEKSFLSGEALSMIGHLFENPIKSNYRRYSYERIKTDALKAIDKFHVFLDDDFFAREYLSGFVQKFHSLVGLSNDGLTIDLNELYFGLKSVLHVFIEKRHSYISSDSTFELDSLVRWTSMKSLKNLVSEAKTLLVNGYLHKTYHVYSSSYDLPLIFKFIEFFTRRDIVKIEKAYKPTSNTHQVGDVRWKHLARESVFNNFAIYFSNFVTIYEKFVHRYFSAFKKELGYFDDFNCLVILLNFKTDYSQKPYLEFFQLYSRQTVENRVLIFDAQDENAPISIAKFTARGYDFANEVEVFGEKFKLISIGHKPFDFFYEETPILFSMRVMLKKRLDRLFKKISESFETGD